MLVSVPDKRTPGKGGRLPSPPDERDLLFANYLDTASLPTPPDEFGHEHVIKDNPKAWKTLGNNIWGDCVLAAAGHETMVLSRLGDRKATFTAPGVLSDYGAITGFNFTEASDQGTDMRSALQYRRKTGVIDAAKKRHRIGAYVKLNKGDYNQLLHALYLFDTVNVGFTESRSTWNEFSSNVPWDYVEGKTVLVPEWGHCVPVFAKRKNLVTVSWGWTQEMTRSCYEHSAEEAYVYLSHEQLRGGKSPEGFNFEQLRADLNQL